MSNLSPCESNPDQPRPLFKKNEKITAFFSRHSVFVTCRNWNTEVYIFVLVERGKPENQRKTVGVTNSKIQIHERATSGIEPGSAIHSSQTSLPH